jgi:hypothetical protein
MTGGPVHQDEDSAFVHGNFQRPLTTGTNHPGGKPPKHHPTSNHRDSSQPAPRSGGAGFDFDHDDAEIMGLLDHAPGSKQGGSQTSGGGGLGGGKLNSID